MHVKRPQVWKIIFFLHTNRSKSFSRLENDQIFFYTFQDPVGTLNDKWQRLLSCNLPSSLKNSIRESEKKLREKNTHYKFATSAIYVNTQCIYLQQTLTPGFF